MKISWLLTLAGLVTSFAQQNDATDPQIAQLIGALTLQYEEAFTSTTPKPPPRSSPRMQSGRRHSGTFYGRSAIERRLVNYHFHRWHIKNEVITVDRVISVGDQVRAIGTWSNTVQEPDGSIEDFNGRLISHLVIEGGTWKIGLNTYDQSRSY